VLSVVTDRLRSFLPQLEAANTLLDTKTTNIEDVNEDEEYIEMVHSPTASNVDVESGSRCIGGETGFR
jgi:hypothetical protein